MCFHHNLFQIFIWNYQQYIKFWGAFYGKYKRFFDEKGPTKTIRISKSPKKQFNYQTGDNISAYIDIYLAIPKNNQEHFNKEYQKIETEYQAHTNNSQATEIKGFKNIHSDIESVKCCGIRACDVLCVFFGKIISYIDLETHYDEKNPEKRKKLDNKFFVPLSSYKKEFVKEIYSLIFGSSNQYSIVHSHL